MQRAFVLDRILVRVELGLLEMALRAEARGSGWRELGVEWGPMQASPDDGRAKSAVWHAFEAPSWVGELIVWSSGEAELTATRRDGWTVAKHYDLQTALDIDLALDELTALIGNLTVPPAARAWGESKR